MTPASKIHRHSGARRFALGTAIVAAMLIGNAGEAGAGERGDPARVQGQISTLIARGEAMRAIPLGEQTLAAHPKDAAIRAMLGQAYLHAGRFASAVAALGDAVSQGDQSGRTALGLALAQIAIGQNHDALATLDRAQEVIPAGDLGLALALAGETGRGVTVLADAVRGGGASPKLRQNLAYAYALDGRWIEARMAAAMDVADDTVDSRLEQWAMSMRAGAEQQRVASLLGVPVIADSGMPVALALNFAPANPAVNPPVQLAASTPAVQAELPPIAAAKVPAKVPAKAPALIAAQIPAQAPAQVAVAAAEPAVVVPEPAAIAPVPAPARQAEQTFVSHPVVQPIPQHEVLAAATPRDGEHHAAARAAHPTLAGDLTPKAAGHVVQLGAFSSSHNADRAKGFFLAHNPELAGHEFVVTRATVHGRQYWRLAAAGFDAPGAQQACSSIRGGGGTCLAYAAHVGGRAAVVAGISHGPNLAVR